MPANLSIDMLFTLGEAFQRLKTLAGGNGERIGRYVQRIVNDPLYRKQVYLAMAGKLIVDEMTQAEWIEREANALARLAELGLPKVSAGELERAWQEGMGAHHRFVPTGLTQRQLLDVCKAAGIKMSSLDILGESLPTEAGVIEHDLVSMMSPTDADHRPFLLNFEEQVVWAKEQDGVGITSVEETLYLLLRAKVDLCLIPFIGGWIRCRNKSGTGEPCGVVCDAGGGLWVYSGDLEYRYWDRGAFPRKFRRI